MKDLRDNQNAKKGKALLLGVGLDNRDEQVRVTKGRNFRLVGGSEETHDRMVETSIKLNEKLKERGKELEDVEKDEFRDLLEESME